MVTNVTKLENVTEFQRMNEEVKSLTENLMRDLRKNDRQFQEWLNEGLSKEGDNYIKSHTTVVGMRVHGRTPKTETLEDMLSVYPASDRRFLLALRVLALKRPHIWGFQGLVWRLRDTEIPKVK